MLSLALIAAVSSVGAQDKKPAPDKKPNIVVISVMTSARGTSGRTPMA
jgi:hypothetical protein